MIIGNGTKDKKKKYQSKLGKEFISYLLSLYVTDQNSQL